MINRIYNSLAERKRLGKKSFAVLIDPDKVNDEKMPQYIELAVAAKVDYFLVGGSLVISNYLEKYIEDYRISNKVVCIVTDNGSNMKAAVNILSQKNIKIQRMPCVAHTLQLTVNQALKSISKQVARYKRIVKFFQSPKQSERLQEMQKELSKKN